MYHSIPSIEYKMSASEASLIMFALLHEVFNENEIRTHWIYHPKSMASNKNEIRNFTIQFCRTLGREDLANEKIKQADDLLAKLLVEKK